MSYSIRRKRLACLECTRRKVKCDKTLPCRNCIVKGINCSRPRSELTLSPVDTPSPDRDVRVVESNHPGQNSNEALLDLVQRLSAKVNSLECTLHQQQQFTRQIASTQVMSSEPTHLSTAATSPETSREVEDGNVAGQSVNQSSSEVEDAATILEFLAWGRRKDPKYQDLITADGEPQHSPRDIDSENNAPFFSSRLHLHSYLQSLLPTRSQLYTLVKYHCDCLLWYHGSFHALVFIKSLDEFYTRRNGQIGVTDTELQWASLLFAIILGSITCAPRQVVSSWRFSDEERRELSHRWFKAMNICLHHSDYMSSHSIFSVQAIATVTHSAHMLGHSNSQSVLLASAVRIAQSMGLHRLGTETDEDGSFDLVDREIGRRVWCQLCTQDWFSIPFTETYLINRTCFDTDKPRNCNDEDMKVQPDEIPTTMNYSRFFYDVAALMPQVQEAIVSTNTLYTRYEKVLEYDQQLRLLATVRLPYYLQNVPIDPAWPRYVPWARRCLAISTSHKVIMIHRKFLGMSFVNPLFSRTRRTCVAAARTIIKELREADSDGGPVLWIHHAFIVAAGIILCLDMTHSPGVSTECDQHRRLVQDGLRILSACETNMIAKRGIPLLHVMLANERQIREKTLNQLEASLPESIPDSIDTRNVDIKEIIRGFYKEDQLNFPSAITSRHQAAEWFSVDNQSNWPPTSEGRAVMAPPTQQPAYGIDFPDNFEDVFALAANYIT